MKSFLKVPFYLFLAVIAVGGFYSCDDDPDLIDNTESAQDIALRPIIKQYVENAVIDTYRSLSDATMDLFDALEALKENRTQNNVDDAAQAYLEARKFWEISEAWLNGAAADFFIDPRIDSWPLNLKELTNTLNDAYMMERLAEEGGVYVEDLGNLRRGFHGIEYILFEDGKYKNVSKITDNETIYSWAVGEDLVWQVLRLEAGWAGLTVEDGYGVSAEKREIIEENELVVLATASTYYHGKNLLEAGNPGSSKRTVTDAAVFIFDGCTMISDEVADVKIGNAHRGKDPDYIESPYSHNSFTDYINNIKSIENAYMGGVTGKRDVSKSLSSYIKMLDADTDAAIVAAISNSIAKIEAAEAIGPFVEIYSNPACKVAMDAVTALSDALREAKRLLIENNI